MSEKESLFTNSDGKLLTFMLGKPEYGIQILEAREVVGMMHIDPVPRTPDFMEGVINLRAKFEMKETEHTKETCIVVVDVIGKMTGVIVDFLSGVVTIEKEDFEDSPELGSNIKTDLIIGMAKLEKRVIIVLDMGKILSNRELSQVHTNAA